MKRLFALLLLSAIVSWLAPSITAAYTLYQIDENDRGAFPQSILDASFHAAGSTGVWQLLDGDTLAQSPGYFPESVRSQPDGISLVSLSSASGSTISAFAVPEPSPSPCSASARARHSAGDADGGDFQTGRLRLEGRLEKGPLKKKMA